MVSTIAKLNSMACIGMNPTCRASDIPRHVMRNKRPQRRKALTTGHGDHSVKKRNVSPVKEHDHDDDADDDDDAAAVELQLELACSELPIGHTLPLPTARSCLSTETRHHGSCPTRQEEARRWIYLHLQRGVMLCRLPPYYRIRPTLCAARTISVLPTANFQPCYRTSITRVTRRKQRRRSDGDGSLVSEEEEERVGFQCPGEHLNALSRLDDRKAGKGLRRS